MGRTTPTIEPPPSTAGTLTTHTGATPERTRDKTLRIRGNKTRDKNFEMAIY